MSPPLQVHLSIEVWRGTLASFPGGSLAQSPAHRGTHAQRSYQLNSLCSRYLLLSTADCCCCPCLTDIPAEAQRDPRAAQGCSASRDLRQESALGAIALVAEQTRTTAGMLTLQGMWLGSQRPGLPKSSVIVGLCCFVGFSVSHPLSPLPLFCSLPLDRRKRRMRL